MNIMSNMENNDSNCAGIIVFTSAPGGGGAERVAYDVYSSLPFNSKRWVVLYDDHGKSNYSTPDIALGRHYFQYMPKYMNYLLQLPIWIVKYIGYLKTYHPMVSWSLCSTENIINLLASVFVRNVKCITSIRGNPMSSYLPIYSKIMYIIELVLSKRYAYRINTNSLEVKQVLIDKYRINPDKIVVIYNPKDINHILSLSSEVVTESVLSTNIPTIITVGRLSFEKGQWHLIRVFSELRKKIPVRLVICGIGPLETKLHTLVDELGIADDVVFLGWCKNPYKYVKKSTIFVLPSLSELQPNALIEAMICGVPVVAADCDYGPREVLNNGEYGLLSLKLDGNQFNSYDALSLSESDMLEKIEMLLRDSVLYEEYKILASERGKFFDKEKIMGEYFDMLRCGDDCCMVL